MTGLLVLASCGADLREANEDDVRAAAHACGTTIEHFGPYYRLDGPGLPNNRVDVAARDITDFRSKAECLSRQLRDRGVRVAIFGPNDQESI